MTAGPSNAADCADKITCFEMASDDGVRLAANRLVLIKIFGSTISPKYRRGTAIVRFFYDGRRKYARKNSWIDMPQLTRHFDDQGAALDYARAMARGLGWVNFNKEAGRGLVEKR